METGLIYKATNKITGKVYIGQTIKTLEHRKKIHLKDSKCSQYKFHRAIRKYGWESFSWCVLLECPMEDLNKQEILTIGAYDSFYNGYNSTLGGNSGNAGRKISEKTRQKMKNKTITDEARRNMSEAAKKRHPTEETKNKISKINTGSGNPFFGKRHSEKAKQKIRKARAKQIFSEETQHKKSEASKGENNPFYGKHHSEETKQILSKANSGKKPSAATLLKLSKSKLGKTHKSKPHSEEAKKKISEAVRGEKHPNYGKHLSEETKQKIKEKALERAKRKRESELKTQQMISSKLSNLP